MVPRKTVALNIVCNNEFESVSRLLNLISPYVDEVVIVNDGPPQQLAAFMNLKTAKATLSWTPIKYDFAEPGRRLALALTTSDWVFVVDCDEEPERKLLAAIPKLIQRQGVSGYWVWLHLIIAGNLQQRYQHLRLFRVTPDSYWSMLFHTFPQGIYPDYFHAEYLEEEDGIIKHIWNNGDSDERSERYSRVGLRLLEKYGDIPSARRHIISAIKGYPRMTAKLSELGYSDAD